MKYESQRKSGNDGVTIYSFSFGKEELKLLHGIIQHYRRGIPKTFETTAVLGRLRNFEKVLIKFFNPSPQGE